MSLEYLVGSYVYDCYEKTTGNDILNSQNNDMFFFILGWVIHQEYPDSFNMLSSELIGQHLSI